MNQNKKKSPRAFLILHSISRPLLPILALVIAVSFFFAMKYDFESDIGHFTADSVPFHIVISCAVISVIFACIFALASYRSASFTAVPDESPITVFSSVFSAIMSVGALISAAVDISIGVEVSRFSQIAAILLPFIGISSILSLIPSLRFSKIRQISAILAAVSVNFSMFADYFDFALPLNSPIRNLVTVMKCSILLYLLSEARFSFGHNITRTTVPFFALSSSLTAAITLGYSLGAAAYAILSDTADNPNPSLLSLALYTAIGIHALGRVLTCAKCVGEYVEPPKEEKAKEEKTEKI